MMKFIVDESTGKSVVDYLRSLHCDVLSVYETMRQAPDREILLRAETDKRILITNDKDFGELIVRSGQFHFGAVLLRLHDESPSNKARVIRSLLEKFAARLEGHFTVATDSDIRIRPLS